MPRIDLQAHRILTAANACDYAGFASLIDALSLSDGVRLNVGPVNPLEGLDIQQRRQNAPENYTLALYTPPHQVGQSFHCYLNNTQVFILKRLSGNGWVPTSQIKDNHMEIRANLTHLRKIGFIIATVKGYGDDDTSAWLLLGKANLHPTVEDLTEAGSQFVNDLLPSRSHCALIAREIANSKHLTRLARINALEAPGANQPVLALV
jgi:hypothetical protein